jgi:hypothetical protein
MDGSFRASIFRMLHPESFVEPCYILVAFLLWHLLIRPWLIQGKRGTYFASVRISGCQEKAVWPGGI